MEKRIRDLEDNAALLKKKSDLLEIIAEKGEKENSNLHQILEEKEKIIYELKMKSNGICENGCHKYNKSMDEVVQAGYKHRNNVLAVKEVAENLKKKIQKLKEENSKLFLEKKQHEEDANDGYEMLQNVRERERKLQIELKECKGDFQKKDAELGEVFEEKQSLEFQIRANEKKKTISNKIITDIQIENDELKTKYEEYQNVVETKEQAAQKELEKVKDEIMDIKNINYEKEEMLRKIKKECEELEIKLENAKDENTNEGAKQHDETEEDENKSTSKSLEEELGSCGLTNKFKCKYCDYRMVSRTNLHNHIVTVHKEGELFKLANAEQKLLQQTAYFTATIHELMKKEISEVKQPCYCKGFCVISHQKHNWRKPVGDTFVKKFLGFKTSLCPM